MTTAPSDLRGVATVRIDNEHVRVTEWRFAPGASTGPHRHEMAYVVVPLTTGRLLLEEPGGTSRHSQLATGSSYFRPAGVEHDVINDNPFDFAFCRDRAQAGLTWTGDRRGCEPCGGMPMLATVRVYWPRATHTR